MIILGIKKMKKQINFSEEKSAKIKYGDSMINNMIFEIQLIKNILEMFKPELYIIGENK